MPHCTPEQLALAALREPLPAEDAVHLAACDPCAAEVAALRRGVDALAVPELAAVGPGVPPPPSVWAGIAAATGVRGEPRPERGTPAPAPPTATPVALHPRRARRATRPAVLLATAAAALVGAGIALGAVALAQRDDTAGTTVAGTRLEALGGNGSGGTAVVVEHPDHSLELDVTLAGPSPGSGYYEVWLADPGLARMVAVGVLHDGKGALQLPSGLRIASYPVVDVSDEPLDGDPAHSSDSVARGVLR